MTHWNEETMVVLFGLTHSLGGASPTLGLMTIAYMSDISTPESKAHNSLQSMMNAEL